MLLLLEHLAAWDGEKPVSIPTQINVITNWRQELDRIVPTK